MNINPEALPLPAGESPAVRPPTHRRRLLSCRVPAGRPFVERLLLIHLRLQNHSYPDTRRLAEESEVCERTILRDLEFMRNRLNLPVVYDPVYHGYRYETQHCLPSERMALRALFGEILQSLAA
jgi:hypothetical protein